MKFPAGGKSRRSLLLLILSAVAVILVVIPPLWFETQTYPVAIVEGTSMYPNLQNGDLVVFRAPTPHTIANGTIIVYVQSDTGVSAFDSLTKPVIIHRVIGTVIQADGMVYYRTKGDNNQLSDPALVPADHVLGVPVETIPKAGLLILFIQSPQGLVATIGFITLFYLSKYDEKQREEKKKEIFLGALAHMCLNGELPEALFKKFELAVKYVNGLQLDKPTDGQTLALVDWVKKGGLDRKWNMKEFSCPACASKARTFESGKDLLLTVCPNCG